MRERESERKRSIFGKVIRGSGSEMKSILRERVIFDVTSPLQRVTYLTDMTARKRKTPPP